MTTPHSSSIHRIRLQGPWEWAVPTPSPEQAWTWNRLRLPEEWDRFPAITGPVWFRRRFNAPTGITPIDRIRVAITTTASLASAHLNGEQLPRLPAPEQVPSSSTIHFEMTQALATRNLLEIFFKEGISTSGSNDGMGHAVVLEIESFPTGQEA